MYIFGLLTGILLVLTLVIIETYLDIKKKKVIETIKEIVVDFRKERGVIIQPKSDKELAQDSQIRYNEERGEGTKIDDLL